MIPTNPTLLVLTAFAGLVGALLTQLMTGETMAVLRKSVEYWKDRNKQRSEESIAFFNGVSLYVDVSLSYDRLIAANSRSLNSFR